MCDVKTQFKNLSHLLSFLHLTSHIGLHKLFFFSPKIISLLIFILFKLQNHNIIKYFSKFIYKSNFLSFNFVLKLIKFIYLRKYLLNLLFLFYSSQDANSVKLLQNKSFTIIFKLQLIKID